MMFFNVIPENTFIKTLALLHLHQEISQYMMWNELLRAATKH